MQFSKYDKYDKSVIAIASVGILLAVVAAWGWIANVVKLAGADFGSITGMLVLRAIGVFVAPLGAVLGFV